MNLMESIGYKDKKGRVLLWWESKSKDKKLELKTHIAIVASAIGTILGTLLVFLAF